MSSSRSAQGNKPLSKAAHALDRDSVRDELGSDTKYGLSTTEAGSRLNQYGSNELEDGPGVQPFKILLRQVANAMMLVSIVLSNEERQC